MQTNTQMSLTYFHYHQNDNYINIIQMCNFEISFTDDLLCVKSNHFILHSVHFITANEVCFSTYLYYRIDLRPPKYWKICDLSDIYPLRFAKNSYHWDIQKFGAKLLFFKCVPNIYLLPVQGNILKMELFLTHLYSIRNNTNVYISFSAHDAFLE